MKVLFVQAGMNIGGHMISALALAHALTRIGVEVCIASPPGPLIDRLEAGIHHVPIPAPLPSLHTWRATRAIHYLLEREEFNIVHTQEHLSTVASWVPCWKHRVPLVATTAGGPIPQYFIPSVDAMVVYSRELYSALSARRRWQVDNLKLIEARIDCELYAGVCPQFSLPILNVGLVSRFSADRIRGVLVALEALANLAGKGVCSVVVGGAGPEKKIVEAQVARLADGLPEGALIYLGEIRDFPSFLVDISIFLGCGRTLLEAMSAGIPSALIGVRGFGGVLTPTSANLMAEYNFSGRHGEPNYQSKEIETAITKLTLNRALLHQLSHFSRGFVKRRYDAQLSAVKLLELYKEIVDKGWSPKNRGLFLGGMSFDYVCGRTWRKARHRLFCCNSNEPLGRAGH